MALIGPASTANPTPKGFKSVTFLAKVKKQVSRLRPMIGGR